MGALKYIKGGLRNLLNPGVSFLSRIDDVSEVSPKAKVYGKTQIYQSQIDDYSYVASGTQVICTKIGKFCSIACGARFLFNSANHSMTSLSTYPFPIFFEEWGLNIKHVANAWDNKGDIIIGNDVWIGYEAVIMAGVTIGDGAIIGTRAVVTKDVAPYTMVGGIPAKPIRKRFSDDIISALIKEQWWNWPEEVIAKNLEAIQAGRIDQLNKY